MPGSYSLAKLSEILTEEIKQTKENIMNSMLASSVNDPQATTNLGVYTQSFDKVKKINLKQTFGFYRKLKDGSDGKILMFPDIEQMHTDSKYTETWVEYSCFDAEITYFLRETLAWQLLQLPTCEENMGTNLTLYTKYWLPFGEILTDMERRGIKIDVDYLKRIQL